MPQQVSRVHVLTRLCLLAGLAALSAAVLHGRVYTGFERIRANVVTETQLSSGGALTVPLPAVAGLEGYPLAVILQLENPTRTATTIVVELNGSVVDHVTVGAERTVRVDLGVPAGIRAAGSDVITLTSDGDGWSIHALEIANVHGFSHGPLSFVVVPTDTERYASAPGWASLAAFAGLLALSLVLRRPDSNRFIQRTQTALSVTTTALFLAVLLLPLLTDYKVLIAAQGFVWCLILIYLPAATRLYRHVTPLIARLYRGAIDDVWPAVLGVVAAVWLKALYAIAIATFVVSIVSLYEAGTGFTSVIGFGTGFHADEIPALRAVPHYTMAPTGYDGQFYAQLALDPLLQDPEIETALDTFAYRAPRILFSWTAYLFGLGHAPWILQAFALQNLACWLILAYVLLRWLPVGDLRSFVLWFGCLFGQGLCLSATRSLLEGPSLLLLALTIVAVERNKSWLSSALVGLSGLGRETNLLSGICLLGRPGTAPAGRALLLLCGRVLLASLPLVLWLSYVRYVHPDASFDPGFGNFALPLSGYLAKWGTLLSFGDETWTSYPYVELLAMVSITTQATWLVVRRRWQAPWWRVGIAYVGLMLFLGPAVWLGEPNAATRVLLPMTCAFNVLLLRDRRFWPLAILGNLTVLGGLQTLWFPFSL